MAGAVVIGLATIVNLFFAGVGYERGDGVSAWGALRSCLSICTPHPAPRENPELRHGPRAPETLGSAGRHPRQIPESSVAAVRKLDNQPAEWLLRHWFTTGVDHEVVRYGRCSTAEQPANGSASRSSAVRSNA